MFHKDYELEGLVEKNISGLELQGARLQDEMIGSKLPVIKVTHDSDIPAY
jgi:hypothetical protein